MSEAAALAEAGDFFEDLLAATLGHPCLSHEFLERFAGERLDRDQLVAHATQHYLYSRHFARNLAGVTANVPDEHARTLLVQNMYEEVGEPSRVRDRAYLLVLGAGLATADELAHAMADACRGRDLDPVELLIERGVVRRTDVARLIEERALDARDATHPALFRRYLRALGLDPAAIAQIRPLPATAAFVAEFEAVCRTAPWLEAMGAIGPGTECMVPSLYTFVLRGIEGSGLLAATDYLFWSIHVHADEGHGRNIVDALADHARSNEARAAIARGAMRVLDARGRWFDGLCAHVFGS